MVQHSNIQLLTQIERWIDDALKPSVMGTHYEGCRMVHTKLLV